MALDFNFAGPAGEQVFSTSPQISDVLARYFGTTPPAAGGSVAAGTGEGGPSIGGTPLAHPLSRGDLGARGSGFGSDNGVAGEAKAFADRNTAVNPSLPGSIALAGSLIPGGLGLPLAGPLGSLGLQALGIDTNGLLGSLGQAFGIGGSPFNVAGPALSPEAIAGILGSVSSLPANAPRVTVMNALNDALAKARGAAQGNAAVGAKSAFGADANGLGGRVVGGGYASGYGGDGNGLAGSAVGGGVLGGSSNTAGNKGPQGAASGGGNSGGGLGGGGTGSNAGAGGAGNASGAGGREA